VENRIKYDKKYKLVQNIGAAIKTLVLTLGLFGAGLLAIYQVLHAYRSPGDFIILLTYWQQLQGT
jgi:hypothetical protein